MDFYIEESKTNFMISIIEFNNECYHIEQCNGPNTPATRDCLASQIRKTLIDTLSIIRETKGAAQYIA